MSYDQFLRFLLVFTRMSGLLLFNPLLSRKSVPVIVKVGLALLLAFVITPTLYALPLDFPTPISFMLSVGREMLLGLALGLIMNVTMSWLLMAGEVMDMEMGLSVSKIYDPQSGISMPVSGNAFNILFTLIFFASDGHLTLIRIVADSLSTFPPGPYMIGLDVGPHIVDMMGQILLLMLKLAMPVMAVELLNEAGLGVLMRIAPQINIFVVGIQLKLLIGLAVVVLAMPSITRLMDATIVQMFKHMQAGIALMLQ